MDWFSVIKVEDIDFDLRGDMGFGYFTLEPVGFNEFAELMEKDNKVLMDFFKEKIRIHPSRVYSYLKERLGREPTDKEMIEWVKRTIMHEATHAAMKEEQFEMADQQTEYGAFTGQFPESTYLRIKQYLRHPATREQLMGEEGAREILPIIGGMAGAFEKNSTRVLREIMTFVDSLTDEMKNKKQQEEARELLTRLEVLARKAGRPHIREVDVQDINVLINRYGKQFEDVLLDIFRSIIGYDTYDNTDFSRERAGEFEKQATTVMSTTAGFESRPRYSKKKEEEEDGKGN